MIVTQPLPVKPATDRFYTCVLSSDPTSIHDASFTVHETKGKRIKTTVSRCYQITEEVNRGGFRSFLVAKDDHHTRSQTATAQKGTATVGEVYSCQIATNGGKSKCSCYAGNTGKACVHVTVLTDLVETGVLVSPQDRQHHTKQVDRPMTTTEVDEMTAIMARAFGMSNGPDLDAF